MPDDTHMDLRERVVTLEQMLVARTGERDEGLQQESARIFRAEATAQWRGAVAAPDAWRVSALTACSIELP
jgi:hypothetical protein